MTPVSGEPWEHPRTGLRLVAVPVPVLHALARGESPDHPVSEYLAGDECAGLWRMRSRQVDESPGDATWITRFVAVPDEPVPVGVAGFHGPPDAAGMVEVGYRIEPAHRRRGYARQSLETLLVVARAHPDVRTVRATVSPDNAASLALIADYGFAAVGEQWDDEDGLEIVYELSTLS